MSFPPLLSTLLDSVRLGSPTSSSLFIFLSIKIGMPFFLFQISLEDYIKFI